jgi:predicted outer membrane repeat protein
LKGLTLSGAHAATLENPEDEADMIGSGERSSQEARLVLNIERVTISDNYSDGRGSAIRCGTGDRDGP